MRGLALRALCAISACVCSCVRAQTGEPPASSSTAASSSRAGPIRNINLTDPTGIAKASLDGDQDQLAFVASTTSSGPDILAKALRQRSLYQLDASSKTVADCGSESKAGDSSANVQCAFVLAGNKLLVNDIAGWAKIMQSNKTIAYPKLVQAIGKLMHLDPSSLRISEFEVIPDYRPFFNVPTVAVSRKMDAFDLALAQQSTSDDGHANVYAIKVLVNDQPIRLVFDTGAPIVLLSADDAKKLDIHPIYPNWIPLPSGGYSSLGIVKHLKIGEVDITNMPVAISSKPLKYSVLGLSAIQYLGAFRMHGNRLHSATGGFADCTTPMDMASEVNGIGPAFLVRGSIDSHAFPFIVATGIAGGIMRSHYGSPSESVSAKPISMLTPFGVEYAWYSTAHGTMQIGNGPSGEQEYQVMYHADHTRFRYYLGADYVRQHDLTMDFNRGVMCLK